MLDFSRLRLIGLTPVVAIMLFCSGDASSDGDALDSADATGQIESEDDREDQEIQDNSAGAQDIYLEHYALWDRILKQIVTSGTRQGIQSTLVNYDAVRGNADFDRLVEWYSKAPVPEAYNEKYAFWVNAYNVYTVKLMAEKSGGQSIMQIDGGQAFDRQYYSIGGTPISLNQIEKVRIKPLGRPDYHFALVCAALSCPNLVRTAYTPENVFWLMKHNAGLFFRNPTKGLRLDHNTQTVHLSKLGEWYGDEFASQGGFQKYAASFLEAEDQAKAQEYSIQYMEYNWAPNSL